MRVDHALRHSAGAGGIDDLCEIWSNAPQWLQPVFGAHGRGIDDGDRRGHVAVQAVRRSGVKLRPLPVTDEGRIDVEALPRIVTNRTRLISVAHVSNVTGAMVDVATVVAAGRKVGAKVMLDGAQRAPHGPLDLPALGVDFYVFAGHKAYGPNGIGALWARQDLLEAMPPFMGGGSMIGRVTFAETTWAPSPRRFEAGTPAIGPAIGLGAACTWMQSLDWTAAHDHEMSLVQRLMDGLQKVDGTRLFGPASLQNRYPVVSFMLEGVHPHDVAQILDFEGIAIRAGHHCCQPLMRKLGVAATNRASFYVYTVPEEIDRLVDGLHRVRKAFS